MKVKLRRLSFVVAAVLGAAATVAPVQVTAAIDSSDQEKAEHELPVADPRYEHDQSLPFESPPEILKGSWPDDPSYVDPQIDQRRAMGLPANRELVVRLVTAPGSVAQAQKYGVVLSVSEEEQLLRARSVEDAAIELSETLRAEGGFGGANIRWSGTPVFSEPSLEIFLSTEWRTRGEATVSESGFDAPVKLFTVRSTLDELESFVETFYERKSAVVPAPEIIEVLNRLRSFNPVAVGYSLRDNRIEVDLGFDAQLPDPWQFKNVPTIVFSAGESAGESNGQSPCTNRGCSPLRAGVEIERNTDDLRCSMGFAVTRFGDENWMTAGHCSGGGRDAQFANGSAGGSYTYNGFFIRNRDEFVGSYGANSYYNGSQLDGKVINESDHLVTNRLMTGPNTSARVSGILTYSVGLTGTSVCRFGAISPFASCGTIHDIGRSFTHDGRTFTNQIDGNLTLGGSHGDSGGPLYRQTSITTAVGVFIGRWNSDSHPGFGSVTYLHLMASSTFVYTTTDKRRDFVLGLYEHGLGRFADSGGYNYWRGRLNTCNSANAKFVARNLLLSSELRTKYSLGTYDARRIRVELAYWTILGRASDAGGLAYWAGVATSEAGWTTVVNSFVDSAEFADRIWTGATAFDGDIC